MEKLLFLCGFPSGGTDLVKTMLNAHPDINLNGEMPFLIDLGDYGYDFGYKFQTLDTVECFKRLLGKLDIWNNLNNIGFDFSELLKQGWDRPMAVEEQILVIWAAIHGALDEIPVYQVKQFEKELIDYARTNYPKVLAAIAEKKKLSDKLEKEIKKIIEEVKNSYA